MSKSTVISATKAPGQPLSVIASQEGVWYPGLDGVRGIAVSLVFTVHYVMVFQIGWSGVMIFFVLSGFLITGGLYDSRHEEHRFRNFYTRRILRIFPLYYFVWLCILFADFFLREQWRPMLALWPAYLGNFARFFAGTTAVDHIYTRFPILPLEIGHFWSLAVEEQFYLLWPFVVFTVANRRTLIRICIAAVVLVPLLRAVLAFAVPNSILQVEFLYRMTFSQADGFLLGGLLALWMRGPEKSRVLRLGSWLFWGALTVLAVACWLNGPGQYLKAVAPSTRWMSTYGFSLIDLASAGMILCALNPAASIFPVLNSKPLRRLGKYSYGFYVYHVMLRPFFLLPMRSIRWFPAILLSWCAEFLIVFLISAASYHFLEMPFLRLKSRFAARPQPLPA